jgi:hypothetical protein
MRFQSVKKLTPFLLLISAFANAQTDSIPLKLIPDPQPITITTPWYPEPPITWPWQPEWPWGIPITIWDPTWSSLVWVSSCGDTYHDNGKLASRTECVDSVMHGKAIYWDETGHKISESTYAEGHLIKSKYYNSRGRVTSLSHYDYKGNYHGVYINYDYENYKKTVTHYDHGIKHGSLEEWNKTRLARRI